MGGVVKTPYSLARTNARKVVLEPTSARDTLTPNMNVFSVAAQNVKKNRLKLIGQTCNPYDHCTQCKDSSHKFMKEAHKERLPNQLTVLGSQDCFSSTEIKNYFFIDSTWFQPCMTDCKRCTTAHDCQECGRYSDEGINVYLHHNKSPVSCKATCDSTLNEHVVPSASIPTCHQCPVGQYYIEGSNPPSCSTCDTGAVWIDKAKNICKACGSGCSICSSETSCQSCSNSNDYIQANGGTCSDNCQDREMVSLGPPRRCKLCPANCDACEDGVGCTKCSKKSFKKEDNTCERCPTQCLDCSSSTQCVSCQNLTHFLHQDSLTCSHSCPDGFRKVNSPIKRCFPCPEGCSECDSNSCTKCKSGKILKEGRCVSCSDDCKVCGPDGCLQCSQRFRLFEGDCFHCSEDCLDCNNLGCLLCIPNKALEDAKCKEGFLINYSMRQFYDPKSPHTFNLRLFLQEHPSINQITYKEFQKSLLDFNEKLEVELESIPGRVILNLTKEAAKNHQFIMRVSPVNKTGLFIGQKIQMRVKSFSKSLDPLKTGFPYRYLLIQKSQSLEVEVLKLSPEILNRNMRSAAEFTSSANSISSSASMGLGIILSLFSADPDGSFLKFNQFLTLLKRLKLIGMYFGGSLQDFIELISGEKPERETNPRRRQLELSIKENQKNNIEENSSGSHSKLDTFHQIVFFEGIFMGKSLVFLFSWVFKILGRVLLWKMKRIQKVEKGKLKFLKYQRKVHFTVLMVVTMDILFFGTRILLHRKNEFWGIVVKVVTGLSFILLTIDLIEVFIVNLRVRFETQDKSKK